MFLTHVKIFRWPCVSIPLKWSSRSETAESQGNSMFNFLRNHQTFPKQLQHITAHCQCMMVPISPISICYHLSFFYYSHPSGWKMVTHCGFDMYFLPWWLMILRIFFMFLFGHNTWIPKIKIKRSCHCPESPVENAEALAVTSSWTEETVCLVLPRTKVHMTIHTTE